MYSIHHVACNVNNRFELTYNELPWGNVNIRHTRRLQYHHLCPEVQGTFLDIRAHIRKNHGGQPLQFECNERGLQTKCPSLPQQRQIRAHIADIAKTCKPDSAGAAIPTATNGNTTTGPTERFKKQSPHEGPVAKPDPPPSDHDSAPVDDQGEATATMQKIGKLNFPPLNPENQSRKALNDHVKTITASIKKTPREAPGHIRPKTALLAAAPVTQAKNVRKEIVVLEVEDMPFEIADDIFHVICPTCCDVVPKIHYAFHKNSKSCRSSEVATATTTRQCNASTQLSTTATDRIATIYRTALRKPNVDGTYKVNGKVVSLQELKEHIWNLSSQVRLDIQSTQL